MTTKIEISGQTFTSSELKEQIKRQYIALNCGRWGSSTVAEINHAIKQAEETLLDETGRCPKTATLHIAYTILRDGKLREY
jgi:hypothetical protein